MKTYRVTVACQTLETYEIEADSAELAAELWAEGKLIDTDDEALDSIVLSVKEA